MNKHILPKLQKQLSFSPNLKKKNQQDQKDFNEGKRQTAFINQNNGKLVAKKKRGTTYSPNKAKQSHSLFKKAKVVESSETFLTNQKHSQITKTNGTSECQEDEQLRHLKPFNRKRRQVYSASKLQIPTNRSELKVIQRTISIVINSNSQQGNTEKIWKNLSKISECHESAEKDLFLQSIDESSITKNEQNFVKIESGIFDEALLSNSQLQSIIKVINF